MKKTIKNLFIKEIAIVLFLLFGCFSSFSQETISRDNVLSAKNQIRFSITPALFQSMDVFSFGQLLPAVKSHPLPSGELSLLYSHFFKHGWGMNLGLGFMANPYNYYFEKYYKGNNTFVPGFSETYYIPMLVLPVSVQKLFPLHRANRWFSAEMGLKMNLQNHYSYIGQHIGYETDDGYHGTYFSSQLSTTQQVLVSGFAKLGFVTQTKRKNTFHYNVVFHYSPQKPLKAVYQFPELRNTPSGALHQNMNYIGFEFCYGLSLGKKK